MDVSVDDLFEKIRQSEQEALGRKAALTERGKLNIFILAFLLPDRSSGLFINILWYRCNYLQSEGVCSDANFLTGLR